MNYNDIFTQLLVLFILMFIGFIIKKIGVYNDIAEKGITSLIIKLALPAMIIDSMISEIFSKEMLFKSGIVLFISFLVYFILMLVSFFVVKLINVSDEDKGIYRFALIFSNVGFMGIPVINSILGDQAIFLTSIYNLPFNLLVFTIGIYIITEGRKNEIKLKIFDFVNPVVVSIIIGYLIFLFSIPIPNFIKKSVKLISDITTPLSMILIGGMLAKSKIKNIFNNYKVYIIAILRLIIFPIITFYTIRLFTKDFMLAAVPCIITGMPVAANTALLAEEYKSNSLLASELIFISNLLSIISIPIISFIISISS